MFNECQLLLLFVLKHTLPVPASLFFIHNQFSPPICVPSSVLGPGDIEHKRHRFKSKAKNEDAAHCWLRLEVVSNFVCSKGTDSQEETGMWFGTCFIALGC